MYSHVRIRVGSSSDVVKLMNILSTNELKESPLKLCQIAEQGNLSLVTQDERPIFITMPFTEELIKLGVFKECAIRMFEEHKMTLRQAAKLADVSLEEMMSLLSNAQVDVIDYDPTDLDLEMKVEF